MALRMVKLERDPKTGSWKRCKVIPADVRAAYPPDLADDAVQTVLAQAEVLMREVSGKAH
jgi:hypothetical protein